jgi:hypothetical protein
VFDEKSKSGDVETTSSKLKREEANKAKKDFPLVINVCHNT